MFEYPSMKNTKRAKFGSDGILFDKIDGSNFRAKWTRKKGFDLFGTRTQLIDETTPYWNNIISLFNSTIREPLSKHFNDKMKQNSLIVFSEYYGDNSFAGRHKDDEDHRLITFDIYDDKNKVFMPPDVFINNLSNLVEIPLVLDRTKLSFELIMDVRNGKYDVNEGVIFKELKRDGSFAGGVPMYKIKTMKYLDKLKDQFKDEWEKYGE